MSMADAVVFMSGAILGAWLVMVLWSGVDEAVHRDAVKWREARVILGYPISCMQKVQRLRKLLDE